MITVSNHWKVLPRHEELSIHFKHNCSPPLWRTTGPHILALKNWDQWKCWNSKNSRIALCVNFVSRNGTGTQGNRLRHLRMYWYNWGFLLFLQPPIHAFINISEFVSGFCSSSVFSWLPGQVVVFLSSYHNCDKWVTFTSWVKEMCPSGWNIQWGDLVSSLDYGLFGVHREVSSPPHASFSSSVNRDINAYLSFCKSFCCLPMTDVHNS